MAINRLLWYQNMSSADAAALLDARQLTEYLAARHPIGRKPHKLETDLDDNHEEL